MGTLDEDGRLETGDRRVLGWRQAGPGLETGGSRAVVRRVPGWRQAGPGLETDGS